MTQEDDYLEKETFEIEYRGKPETVTIREMRYGEREDILKACTVSKIIGKEYVSEIDPFKLKQLSITQCLVQAPFPIKIQHVRELPSRTGDLLWKRVDALSSGNDKKKATGSDSGSESQDTSQESVSE